MQDKIILKSIWYGILASAFLLGIYFAVLTLVSGWNFAQDQFSTFWYFLVSLAVGFGIQMGLYTYLKNLIHYVKSKTSQASADPQAELASNGVRGKDGEGKILGVTGTTSTAAMISCCTHYLANILPVLGTIGVVTFVAQYQIQLFWVGLLFNLGGIFYIANRIVKFKQARNTHDSF